MDAGLISRNDAVYAVRERKDKASSRRTQRLAKRIADRIRQLPAESKPLGQIIKERDATIKAKDEEIAALKGQVASLQVKLSEHGLTAA